MIDYHELTGFQRDLLKAAIRLNDQSTAASGQAIRRQIERNRDANINHGRLYPNLDVLVEAGLVKKGSVDERTNAYRPTQRAREMVRQELQSWMGVIDCEQVAIGGQR